MAARRTDVHRLQEAVRLHRMGKSNRRVARALKMGRNTVEQAVKAFRAAGLLDGDPKSLPEASSLIEVLETARPPKAAPQQASSVEPWRPDIERLWRRGAGPTPIHDWLRLNAEGFTGKPTSSPQSTGHRQRTPDSRRHLTCAFNALVLAPSAEIR